MNHHSCSTFLFTQNDQRFVGHNLDDYIEVPGLVVVNKRGIAKHNLSWDALRVGPFFKEPRIHWISQYGSMTYNPMGRELPDGGMNEAGLYVGEMTLFGTVYPADPAKPKFYHQLWIQYLLDNFASVDQVLDHLDDTLISGHCQWHFFLADKQGRSAAIEFLGGKAIIHSSGDDMPYPVLCNRSYEQDLALLKQYESHGGNKPLAFDTCEGDPRFAWAVSMLDNFPSSGRTAVDHVFSILKQLDCGNNRFAVAYDLNALRMYFHTYRNRSLRFVDYAAFDFSPNTPTMILDIHRPIAGDVASEFLPFSEEINHNTLMEFVHGINWGSVLLNNVWTRIFTLNLLNGIHSFKPAASHDPHLSL